MKLFWNTTLIMSMNQIMIFILLYTFPTMTTYLSNTTLKQMGKNMDSIWKCQLNRDENTIIKGNCRCRAFLHLPQYLNSHFYQSRKHILVTNISVPILVYHDAVVRRLILRCSMDTQGGFVHRSTFSIALDYCSTCISSRYH